MAKIIGAIGTSHVPTIGAVYDRDARDEPAWKPLFEAYAPAQAWLEQAQADVLVIFYNDHATRFFFDLYPTFAIGVAETFGIADEGAGPRALPPIPGHPALAAHLLRALVDDGFDMAVFQGGAVDHGCHSPLPLLWPPKPHWPGAIVPVAINVLQYPLPTARRCLQLGQAVGRAIAAFPEDLRVAVVGTGGLSHQVHGERTGFNDPAWDRMFLDLIAADPAALAALPHAEYVRRGGAESVEMIMWLAMRGALGAQVNVAHEAYYLPTTTAMAVTVYEPVADARPAAARPAPPQRDGLDEIAGTYPFDIETSHRKLALNRFLWRFTDPAHRAAFLGDPAGVLAASDLEADDVERIVRRDWLGLIRAGASFFLLEKLARVSGVTNLQVYAAMRGEDLETFMATRRVPDAR